MLNQNCKIGEIILSCRYFQILFIFLYTVHIKIEASSPICQIFFNIFKLRRIKVRKQNREWKKPIYWMETSRCFQWGTVGIASVGRGVGREVENGKGKREMCYWYISFCFSLPKDIVIDNKLNLFSILFYLWGHL